MHLDPVAEQEVEHVEDQDQGGQEHAVGEVDGRGEGQVEEDGGVALGVELAFKCALAHAGGAVVGEGHGGARVGEGGHHGHGADAVVQGVQVAVPGDEAAVQGPERRRVRGLVFGGGLAGDGDGVRGREGQHRQCVALRGLPGLQVPRLLW